MAEDTRPPAGGGATNEDQTGNAPRRRSFAITGIGIGTVLLFAGPFFGDPKGIVVFAIGVLLIVQGEACLREARGKGRGR